MKYKAYLMSVTIAALLLTQACTRQLDPEEPCNFVQSNQLQRVSWKGEFPIRLMVHSSVPREANTAIEEAIDNWNRQLGIEAFRITLWGIGGPTVPAQDFNNIIYWMTDSWEEDLLKQQARTTIYWTGAKIYEADIRINATQLSQFKFSFADTTKAFNELDFESLLIHELGHVLGLAHIAEPSSVMQKELANGVERREISNGDLNSLKCEYDSRS